MSIAVSYDDEEIIRMMYDFYLKSRIERVKNNNTKLANYLITMKDIYIELKWKVSIPLLSSYVLMMSFKFGKEKTK